MKYIKYVLIIQIFLFFNLLFSEGYTNLDFTLNYENITKKLLDGWKYNRVGPGGINKVYEKTGDITSDWENSSGFKILTDFNFSPSHNIFVKSRILFLPQYADRFYQTVNDEHRMFIENTKTKLINLELKYDHNLGYLRYFKAEGHYHWGYEGDLFSLLKEQFDTERYLRVSGRTVPEGAELNLAYRDKKLHLFLGPEIMWGYHDGIYLKTGFDTDILEKTFTHTIFYTSDKPEYITFANPQERVQNIAYVLKFNTYKKDTLEIGFLYKPFRLDKEYKYVKEVEEGEGTYASKYQIFEDKTKTQDAFGSSIQYTIYSYKKLLEEIKIKYSYLGAVAGNKQEISFSAWKRINKKSTLSGGFVYRKPLYGPLPLIKDINGTIILSPRGPFDPFWVHWENRENTTLSLTYTYDPTAPSWFYKYQADILDYWNLNPNEDAKFAFAVQAKIMNYPTNTDRLYYWDENGKIVWESNNATGAWATKSLLGEITFLGRLRIYPLRLTGKISFGDSLAKGSYAYTEENLKPITNFYKLSLITDIGRWWYIETDLGFNIWGPEEWFETFGESYDRFYKFAITRKLNIFDNNFYITARYIGARDVDNKYLSPEIAEFDEIYFSLSTKFALKLNF
ncbi:MAG: hypothetical protein ACK4WJ_04085 [Endomicrobiia bacterium]